MNEMLGYRAAGLAAHDPLAWDAFLCLYRACGRRMNVVRRRCFPGQITPPSAEDAARQITPPSAEDAARGLIMYGAWG
jgi:hypothetical protein